MLGVLSMTKLTATFLECASMVSLVLRTKEPLMSENQNYIQHHKVARVIENVLFYFQNSQLRQSHWLTSSITKHLRLWCNLTVCFYTLMIGLIGRQLPCSDRWRLYRLVTECPRTRKFLSSFLFLSFLLFFFLTISKVWLMIILYIYNRLLVLEWFHSDWTR